MASYLLENQMMKKKKLMLWLAFLATLILLPYLQMRSHEFINWDDPYYIYNNPMVSQGLSWLGVGWALTTGVTANWHPLTWLSHMLDFSLFGPMPAAAHMVNLLWYIGCVILTFLFFLRIDASFEAAFLMRICWVIQLNCDAAECLICDVIIFYGFAESVGFFCKSFCNYDFIN